MSLIDCLEVSFLATRRFKLLEIELFLETKGISKTNVDLQSLHKKRRFFN